MSPQQFLLVNGRVIDPSQSIDGVMPLEVRSGRIASIGSHADESQAVARSRAVPHIDATGLIVCPGFIDLHVHLREPGFGHKETIQTGGRAAVAGGFTAVCCMPNTAPSIDNVETLRWVLGRAKEASPCRVHVIAAITDGRRGLEVTDFSTLLQAGAVAFSDDGDGVEDSDVMRTALEQAQRTNAIVIAHCGFRDRARPLVMHEGDTSRRLGLPGSGPGAEEAMIDRDIELCQATGARYHVAHVSTAAGVAMVRQAKRRGLPITAEVCPHHLLLCDQDVATDDGRADPNFKMSPPLRSRSDVAACVEGVYDRTIDCIVTDHAPHTIDEKGVGFVRAPFGVIGLETSLACAARALLEPGRFGWPELIDRMTTAPAHVLRLTGGTLRSGCPADVTLIDPQAQWTIDPSRFESLARNTPFAGWKVRGKTVATIVAGALAYVDPAYAQRFDVMSA